MYMDVDDYVDEGPFVNEEARHENVVEFMDRRLRQLSNQYEEVMGRQSFVARVPSGEGFDRWHFRDGMTFRNAFSALDYQYVLMWLKGMREFD